MGSKVLLAEKDDSVRQLIARTLRRHGCTVLEAANGLEAIERATYDAPDLVILDLWMPGVGGLEVVRLIKQRYGVTVPVIVLSALDEPNERLQAFEVGADDFVPKPVHLLELVKRVQAVERTRRAYAEVQQANERADRLRLFMAEAAALLAHDLGNGLSIVSANLRFLEEELDIDDDDMCAALDATNRALRRMTGLVRNFVDISRLEDAAMTPERSEINISDLLTQAALIHDPRTTPGDQGIVVDAPPRLLVKVDPVFVERVIHNLLSNAVRYVNRGGTVYTHARIETKDAGSELVIGVGNTGPAVPRELREQLFTKYRKGADGKGQRGMGLYFCRLACEAHGGTITMQDHPQFPAYFVIRMPV